MSRARIVVVVALAAAVGHIVCAKSSVGLASGDPSARLLAAPSQAAAPDVAAAYNAVLAPEGGTDVRLPLWRSGHTASELHTGIAVTNVGDRPAEVRITLLGYDGVTIWPCGAPCSATLEPLASHYWWPSELPGVPEDPSRAYGTAVITSRQPIVAVVHDVSLSQDPARSIDAGAFRGLTADVWGDETRARAHVPLFLKCLGRTAAQRSARSDGEASQLAGISGCGESGVSALNRDLRFSAQIAESLYPQSGGPPTQFLAQADPGEWTGFYAPAMVIGVGAYAAVIESDRVVGAISRTDWPSSGGVYVVEDAAAANELTVPYVTNDESRACSLVTIQNTDETGAATAVFDLYAVAGGQPVLTRRYPIGPGTSITLRLCDEDDFIANLPQGFVGWARVRADDVNQRLAVQTTVDYPLSRSAVSGYVGVPANAAAARLFAPAVHAAWPSGGFDPLFPSVGRGAVLTSSVVVVNPAFENAEVTETYVGLRGDCAGVSFQTAAVTVPAMGQVVLEPSTDGILPDGCLASGRLDASGDGVLAVVLDRGWSGPQPTPEPTIRATSTGTRTIEPTVTPTIPLPTATATLVPAPITALYCPYAER